MKKSITILLLSFLTLALFAQEESAVAEAVVDKPVRQPFESAYLIDNQTTYIPFVNTLEYVIQHKFGTVENGISDLFGIYAPGANVRIGFNYVFFKNVQLGWGLTKNNFTNDFNAKWTIFEQTRNNTFPVALTLYGVAGINGQPKDYFGKDYSFIGRMSYFAQVIASRKFNDELSLQVAASFSHFNMVDRTLSDFDKVGVHVNGRYKFSPTMSVIFNYDQPLPLLILRNKDGQNSSPNVAAGLEISTSTHAFQIYAGQQSAILPQDMMLSNYNPFAFKNFAIGFTITRLWN
jgi:hypothetical protein